MYQQATPINFDWNVDAATYRADSALNFHTLRDFHRDPKAFHEGYFAEREESDAMRFGTALHCLLLQGRDAFDAQTTVFDPPINEKTGEPFGTATKAYREAYEAFLADADGKTIISAQDVATCEKLRTELLLHPNAAKILYGDFGASEVPLRGSFTIDAREGEIEIPVKALIDRYCSNGLVEIKTTAAFDDVYGRDRFRYTIYDYQYLVQLAFYHKILTEFYGAPFVPCWIVALERNAPNRVAVYAIEEDVVTKARDVASAWLIEYARSKSASVFHSRYDEIRTIQNYDYSRDI